jgi:hypothetical protein
MTWRCARAEARRPRGAQRMSDAQYAVEGRLIDIVDEAWARDTLPVEGTALDGRVGLHCSRELTAAHAHAPDIPLPADAGVVAEGEPIPGASAWRHSPVAVSPRLLPVSGRSHISFSTTKQRAAHPPAALLTRTKLSATEVAVPGAEKWTDLVRRRAAGVLTGPPGQQGRLCNTAAEHADTANACTDALAAGPATPDLRSHPPRGPHGAHQPVDKRATPCRKVLQAATR